MKSQHCFQKDSCAIAIRPAAGSGLHLIGQEFVESTAPDMACHIANDALLLQQFTKLQGLSCAWPANSSHPTRASDA